MSNHRGRVHVAVTEPSRLSPPGDERPVAASTRSTAPNQRPDRPVPLRAVLFSVLCLGVPLAAAGFIPGWTEEQEILVWLPALVPAFLLTYYRGWNGASLAIAGGMTTIALVQVEIFALGLTTPSWSVIFGIVLLLTTVSLGSGWVAELLHRERERAQRSALTDQLTELPNRRHATIFLEAGWAAAQRGRDLSVVLFDVDRFKEVNDARGHAEGDRVLQALGTVLSARTRSMDLSARFGGEEFLAILPDCPADQAVRFAEDVRVGLAGEDFGWGRVTLSAGVATFEVGMGGPDVLVAAADQALYTAKEEGRNRVVRADRTAVPRPRQEESEIRKPGSLQDLEVLLVDDDASSLHGTERLLERLGCRVTARYDPRQAVASVREGAASPDLIVTDIVMPEMSGFTLVDLVGRLRPGVPVLYISGTGVSM